MAPSSAPIPGLNDDRVLVVVQLAGGNDGLNTLIPHGDDAYYKARPKLAVEAKKVLKIDEYLGFHPELVELKGMLDDGELAVVQNVGYPNPDRSHFRSSEIWETASPAGQAWTTGWLGRYFDSECGGSIPDPRTPARRAPCADILDAPARARSPWPTRRFSTYPPRGSSATASSKSTRWSRPGSRLLDFVQRTANQTLSLAKQLKEATSRPQAAPSPMRRSRSLQSLKTVAQLIAAEVPTRIYYVTLTGFDTHATQFNRHSALLQELSQSLSTFHRDLKASGHLDRTLVDDLLGVRPRVAENKSAGTDHGTANLMLLTGGGIAPGLHGGRPDPEPTRRPRRPELQGRFPFDLRHDPRPMVRADSRKILEGAIRAGTRPPRPGVAACSAPPERSGRSPHPLIPSNKLGGFRVPRRVLHRLRRRANGERERQFPVFECSRPPRSTAGVFTLASRGDAQPGDRVRGSYGVRGGGEQRVSEDGADAPARHLAHELRSVQLRISTSADSRRAVGESAQDSLGIAAFGGFQLR